VLKRTHGDHDLQPKKKKKEGGACKSYEEWKRTREGKKEKRGIEPGKVYYGKEGIYRKIGNILPSWRLKAKGNEVARGKKPSILEKLQNPRLYRGAILSCEGGPVISSNLRVQRREIGLEKGRHRERK